VSIRHCVKKINMKNRIIPFLIFFFLHLTSNAQYNSFSISVNSNDIGMCNFEFYKYSTRSNDLQIFTWDGTTLTPYNIPNTIRTYRGRITNHPNYKAFAVWYPDNKLYIKVLGGKGSKNGGFVIDDIATQNYTITPLNLATVDTPQKSNRVLTSGYSCTYNDLMNPDLANGDYETLIAMWENGVNIMDYFATRDLGLSITTNLLIIPIDSSIATGSDIIKPNNYTDQINPVLTFWKTTGSGGGAGTILFCPAHFKGGRTSFNRKNFGAMPHELGHTLHLGHYNNQKDAMDGNQYYFGRNSVAIILSHLNLPENSCLTNDSPNYTDPLHPWVAEDYAHTSKNEYVDIDVLANDRDYNNDLISIKDFDAISQNGGSITQVGNVLRYTPATDFIGRDYFNYTAESGQGNGYFTNNNRVIVEVRDTNCYLALRYSFEETADTIVHDSGWTISSQNATLLNANFSTNSIPGIVGKAIDLSDSTAGVILNDVLDPLDQDLSVSVWFKLNQLPTVRSMIFDSGTRGGLAHQGLSISVVPGGISFHAQPEDAPNTGAVLFDSTTLSINKWYHAVLVVDRSMNTLKAYVDGQEITYSPANNIDFAPNHIIKGYPGIENTSNPNKTRIATALGVRTSTKIINPGSPVNGAIDEFRIYTKALTSSEVNSLYNNPGDLLTSDCDTLNVTNNEDVEKAKIKLYPNPTSGIVYIDNKSSLKIESIQIFSVCGKLQMVFHSNSNNELDLSNLNSGLYYIIINTDNTRLFDKILIQ